MRLSTAPAILALLCLSGIPGSVSAAKDAYDFVIVGGGTAGCVVAARMCEAFPDKTFAIVEQGAPRTPDQELAVLAARLMGDLFAPNSVEGVTRIHLSEPNPALFDEATGTMGRVQGFVEATTLGGSSNIAAAWETPTEDSIKLYGIEGLDETVAADYFARIEEKVKPMAPPDELLVENTQEIIDAFERINFEVLEEPAPFLENSNQGNTIYVNQIVMDEKGRRRSAYTVYLKDAMEGPCSDNLDIIQDATVTKLIVEDIDLDATVSDIDTTGQTTSKVTGIEYMLGSDASTLTRLTANEEVIVSAGPFGSPRLLQLSGIGPAEILPSRGIEVVKDLPVGQNTRARPLGVALGVYQGIPLLPYSDSSIYLSQEARDQFLAGEGGPLAQHISCTNGRVEGDLGYHTEVFGSLFEPNQPLVGTLCFSNPRSTGNLTVKSADPNTDFEFHSNLLSDPDDLADMIQCMDLLDDSLAAFSDALNVSNLRPDSQPLADWVRATTGTSYHVSSGCAIGSVVDGTTFKVFGFENLRVVDASVLPVLSRSAGLLSSVYLVAEFFADKMIEEYKKMDDNDGNGNDSGDGAVDEGGDSPDDSAASGLKTIYFSLLVAALAVVALS